MRHLCLWTSDGMDDGLLQLLVECLFIYGCGDVECDICAMICVCACHVVCLWEGPCVSIRDYNHGLLSPVDPSL